MVAPGLVLLAVGAELLVRGASRLAGALGLSPLVVGLTVVAFGTSSPELAASLDFVFGAATAGRAWPWDPVDGAPVRHCQDPR